MGKNTKYSVLLIGIVVGVAGYHLYLSKKAA